MFTSNYSRKGKDPGAIAISRSQPDWYSGDVRIDLAPTWDMIWAIKDGKITYDDYICQYINMLITNKFDAKRFLESLPTSTPTYLLCYESPTDLCHRRLLADYIEIQTGVYIPEWKNERELEEEQQNIVVDTLLKF